MGRLDWDRARARDATRQEPKFRADPAWRYQPATKRQVALLNQLHVERYGTPYKPPSGLTKAQAGDLIDRLSPRPSTPARTIPSWAWRGEHIDVGETASGKPVWSWWKCVRCHGELDRGRDIEAGLHRSCLRQVSEAEAERLRTAAREADRERYRRDHASRAS